VTENKLAYSPAEAAKALGLAERTVRKMIATEELRCTRVGRRVLIAADTLRELLRDPSPAAR